MKTSDILVPIPDEDLTELLKIYEQHVEWAPYIASFIKMAMRWKQSEKYKNTLIFTSPGNSWREDGSIIVFFLFSCYHILIFTIDEKCENLTKGLLETKLIDYNRKPLFYSTHSKHVKAIQALVKSNTNLEICEDITHCVMFFLTPKQGKELQTESPSSEYYVKKLDLYQAKTIDNLWPHSFPNSEKYLSAVIEMNGGYGVFLKKNDQIVAWIIKHCFGHLGVLHVLDDYKKKGFGSLLTKRLSKDIAEEDNWPFGTVVHTNLPSLAMFRKIGFKELDKVQFIEVKNK